MVIGLGGVVLDAAPDAIEVGCRFGSRKITDNDVRIGEAGNLAVLKKDE